VFDHICEICFFPHKTCSPYFLSMLWKVIKKRFIICNSRTILFKNQTNMFLFITESRWFTYTRWFAEISYTVYTHIYYWVVMAVIGQGTSLSVRQSFKVKPVHCAHRTRTANPVIPSKKSIRGLCCNLFRTLNSPWVSLMWW
jgi:hypothetical protein